MAAEIDPWASTFRDRTIRGLNSARLTLVKREQACVVSYVTNRAHQGKTRMHRGA